MNFKVPYKISEDAKEAFKVAKEKLDPNFLSQFKVNIKLSVDEDKLIIKGKAKGFSFSFQFLEQECFVEFSLSLILRPLKSKIAKGLQEGLEHLL
jgi:hypothetical protein